MLQQNITMPRWFVMPLVFRIEETSSKILAAKTHTTPAQKVAIPFVDFPNPEIPFGCGYAALG